MLCVFLDQLDLIIIGIPSIRNISPYNYYNYCENSAHQILCQGFMGNSDFTMRLYDQIHMRIFL